MTSASLDTLNTRRSLTADGQSYEYFSLSAAAEQVGDISRLPFSLKVLMENLLRHQDNRSVTVEDITKFKEWLTTRGKPLPKLLFAQQEC